MMESVPGKRRSQSPLEILLVEDSPLDARLTMEALKETEVPTQVHVIDNGEDALAYLRQEGYYAHACSPDLVLLDLNLPKRHGREVLAEAKSDPRLRSIPVIILSGCVAEDDIRQTYDLHANCFISKPGDISSHFRVVQAIEKFWTTTVRLPHGEKYGNCAN